MNKITLSCDWLLSTLYLYLPLICCTICLKGFPSLPKEELISNISLDPHIKGKVL